VVGPERQGDGSESTSLLWLPAETMRTVLANFAFNDWPVGAPTPTAGSWSWFSYGGADANTPVDDDAVDAADILLDREGVRVSVKVTSDTTGVAFLRALSESFKTTVMWNDELKIGMYPINLQPRDPYSSRLVSQYKRSVLSYGMNSSADHAETEVLVKYLFSDAQNKFTRETVYGAKAPQARVAGSYSQTYGPAEST